MAHVIRIGRIGIAPIIAIAAFCLNFPSSAFGQMPNCSVSAAVPSIHAEGLAEQIGDITFTCSAGAGAVNTLLLVTLSANVTNRVDSVNSAYLDGITLTGAGVVSGSQPSLENAQTVVFQSVQWAAGPATFTISGIRVAAPTLVLNTGSTVPDIYATFTASRVAVPTTQTAVAQTAPTLLSSVLNYGVPCTGSPLNPPLPVTVDFNALIAAQTASSTVRVTKASAYAFAPKQPTADFGVRFLITLTGYGPNAQVWVPDVIVGDIAPSPTSAGSFNQAVSGGTYTPGNNQLLLARVLGADPTGNGGLPVLAAAPGATTSFASVTQLNLVNGGATVTYEVLAANTAASVESAQIPVFVAVPASQCPDSLQNSLGVTLAPASTVSIATQTDSIPRYIAATPASDCSVIGDCAQPYFPVLQISQASVALTGTSQGKTQSAVISVNNSGTSQMNFTVSIAYQTSPGLSTANWLSASATGGVVESTTFAALKLTADPTSLLVASTYSATLTINAGSAGTVTLPVTFTVSPTPPPTPPSPTVQSVVNSANLQAGPVTANSFATLFGSNLASQATPPSVTVSFNGINATVVYDSATQMNVLIPASLGTATTAAVVATIDGVASNSFSVSLLPNAPAVFNPGIENQNYSVNSASAPASVSNGEIIQIFLTGLAAPVTSPVTVNIGTASVTAMPGAPQIPYAGAVVSIPGLDQVNFQLPSSLTFSGGSAPLSICVPGSNGQPVCSATVPVYLH